MLYMYVGERVELLGWSVIAVSQYNRFDGLNAYTVYAYLKCHTLCA